MAQETGTAILARARILAQDNDSASNFSVNAANALILLNDILLSLCNNVSTKTKTLGAGSTSLTFTAGESSHLLTGVDVTEFESFHPSNSTALSYPLSPALQRVSVQDMLVMLQYDGDNALAQQAAEWTHVAAEKTQDDTAASGTEKWRVYGFPVINRTRSMTVKAVVPVTISAIGDYPDIDGVDSRLLSRLLAYEIARLNKENSPDFLNGILKPVPQDVLNTVYGGAVRGAQLYDHVLQRGDW